MKKTYNKRRRAQPASNKCPQQTSKCKTLKSPYNLRSKANDVVPLNILTENNNRKPFTEGTLRRSKRIHQKKNVHLKMYDCVSDYYLQMQNKPEFTINKKHSDDTFCEVLQEQLSHVHISSISTKCLQTIKNLVNDIDAHLEGSGESEPDWLETTPDFFRIEKPFRLETLLEEGQPEVELSPMTSLDFLKYVREPQFTFDEDILLPPMPELKNPSPLKFYPRMMHNL